MPEIFEKWKDRKRQRPKNLDVCVYLQPLSPMIGLQYLHTQPVVRCAWLKLRCGDRAKKTNSPVLRYCFYWKAMYRCFYFFKLFFFVTISLAIRSYAGCLFSRVSSNNKLNKLSLWLWSDTAAKFTQLLALQILCLLKSLKSRICVLKLEIFE